MYLYLALGVLLPAEIIPFEPDVVRTTEGKSARTFVFQHSLSLIIVGMDIQINHQKHTIAEHTSLQVILNAQLGEKQTGVAVAINDTVIPKSEWGTHHLQQNDHLLIIKATQGG